MSAGMSPFRLSMQLGLLGLAAGSEREYHGNKRPRDLTFSKLKTPFDLALEVPECHIHCFLPVKPGSESSPDSEEEN